MSREVVRARRTASAAAKSGWVQGIAARCCNVLAGASSELFFLHCPLHRDAIGEWEALPPPLPINRMVVVLLLSKAQGGGTRSPHRGHCIPF